MKNKKELVFCSFSALGIREPEVRIKNQSRTHIHPNRLSAIRDSGVKQLFSNAQPQRLEFGCSKRPIFYLDLIYFIHCTTVL